MSDRPLDLLVGLFTRDLGRKLLALLFALVLFDLLDAEVQASDRLTVHVVYVDASELGTIAEAPDRSSKLIVVERSSPELALVVADRPRPDVVTLRLHATKDSIERAKSRRHSFQLRLGKAGRIEPAADELEGVQQLLAELSPGASIEIDPPLRLLVEPEETRRLAVGDEEITTRGDPAPGFDPQARTFVVRPPEVLLVGPRSAVLEAWDQRSRLFDPLLLDGSSRSVTQEVGMASPWSDRLRLLNVDAQPLSTLRVTCEFRRRMAPVPAPEGLFRKPVQVLCDEEALRAADPDRSWRAGWRLRLDAAEEGTLELPLQFEAPASALAGAALERVKLNLAREQVELVVRAHEAAGVERTSLKVTIVKFADFPDDLDVKLAPGVSPDVAVTWEAPALPSSGRRIEDEGDGEGNGDGE